MVDEPDRPLGRWWWRGEQFGHGICELADSALVDGDLALQPCTLAASSLFDPMSARSSTKARITYTLKAVARSLLSTMEA